MRAPADPGLQPERTALAWRRTSLALIGLSLGSARVTWPVIGAWSLALAGAGSALGVWLDVDESRGRARAGRWARRRGHMADAVREYETAVELYQGDLLEEDVYEAWTEQPRRELRQAYVDALNFLAGHAFEAGQDATCVGHSRRLLAGGPAGVAVPYRRRRSPVTASSRISPPYRVTRGGWPRRRSGMRPASWRRSACCRITCCHSTLPVAGASAVRSRPSSAITSTSTCAWSTPPIASSTDRPGSPTLRVPTGPGALAAADRARKHLALSLIHISEPTRPY